MSWTENIRKCEPYTPGEQPKEERVVKLNTNENPYDPSPRVLETLRAMETGSLRRYPDPTAGDLIRAIALRYGVEESQVFAGVGSDDVLAMLFMTCFNSDKPILFPDITYSFYDVWAELFGIPYRKMPLDENFHIRPEDYKGENGGIVFPNPNAPTGVSLAVSAIEDIVRSNPDSVVIVDEAYVDFGSESVLPLIERYDNLVVVQTFSKSRSLAGLRIGFCFGSKKLIRCLNDVKYSFNSYTLSRPAIALGCAALSDEDYFKTCCRKIMKTREQAEKKLKALGFVFEPSSANFIFASHPEKPAGEIFEALRKKHIYVRWFDKDRIRNYLRITIGNDREMEELFEALGDILGKTL